MSLHLKIDFWPVKVVTLIGGAGLMSAMLTDAVAVIGRHMSLPVLGAIEIVQASVLISGSAALIIATLLGAHACVHLVTERLPAVWRDALGRIAGLASGLFFIAVLAGSGWIFLDEMPGFEESEVLHMPLWPLRAISMAGLGISALVFAYQALVTQNKKDETNVG